MEISLTNPRAELDVTAHTLDLKVDGEIVVSQLRGKDYVCHTTDLGHLALAFNCLVEAEQHLDRGRV